MSQSQKIINYQHSVLGTSSGPCSRSHSWTRVSESSQGFLDLARAKKHEIATFVVVDAWGVSINQHTSNMGFEKVRPMLAPSLPLRK